MAGFIDIVLERDGHDQPWGFRLQGGVDLAMPLSVQRVLVGTPADGVLLKGDVLSRISCTETKNITHQQAADLFNNAGNQIAVRIKRQGVQPTPASAAPTQPIAPIASVPVPKPCPIQPENPVLRPLPKTQFIKPNLRAPPPPVVDMETLSIQSQPYRTLPLVQPTAKVRTELGVGSLGHLKMQGEHITGQKEPQMSTQNQAVAARAKQDELLMKQKVTGTLQHIQQTQQSLTAASAQQSAAAVVSAPVAAIAPTVKQQYNSPINLYSTENVQEVIRQQGVATQQSTGVHPAPIPAKPTPVILTPSKEYNPQSSATWRALQETDPPTDPKKVANYSSLKEHDPIYSEVYTAPVAPKPGQRPPARNAQPSRSPVSDLLPPSMRPAGESAAPLDGPQGGLSPVLSAALADAPPVGHKPTLDNDKIPMFETNSIGGRRKIAQTATFNKLMMDVLGE